ncbi:MAG: cell division protein ZapA [Neptuniibacter sp.]
MSQEDAQAVTVKLLDKEFSFNCPADSEHELRSSAQFLNEKMLEIRKSGRVLGLERIAVMAALNLAHDIIQMKEQHTESIEDRLRYLGNKIDLAMTEKDQNDKDL